MGKINPEDQTLSEEIEICLPKLGESILSATVVHWFKKEGDHVLLDEPLLEVSTDKINSEIPSPVSGVLTRILAQQDQELQVGEPLARITTSDVAKNVLTAPRTTSNCPATSGSSQATFYSPSILRLAQEHGITMDKLSSIRGTGAEGRVTKQDLERYLEEKSAQPTAQKQGVESLKLTGMRKAIADNMVRSFYAAPHATLVTEVDVTKILKKIQGEREAFFAKEGVKLTITSFIAQAISQALISHPLINSSLQDDMILVKHFVNLGIAVSVDQGLMVPVIRECNKMTLSQIAHALHTLSTKARSGTLSLDEISEGTISLTNFGMSGVQIGIPIIRYPEVAIVGIGAISRRVVPLEDDSIAIRSMIHVSLTFDHRVLDGMYGCSFLGAVKAALEK